ncbi:MAG TPA: 50S ribosomal protein L25 [Candidatus Anaerobutyricum stercoripullorum]|uniref:50S ribosomal protein L25 n=1 Tax=Candidatus Anaerobutyricum stercoripullorum TaxID=2838456 RepID=A0A9D1X476_9FIRM|nr:50S ribosomal protein L25 [Candidatus Anaerobutyricum stercoripullorum]
MDVLKAERRDQREKAKRLRREGYITGNVCGKEIEGSIPVKMEKKAVNHVLGKNRKGAQIALDIDGEVHNVLIKDISYNALDNIVEEIEFQALVKNQKVQSVAEIVIENRDKVEDGVVQEQLEEIEYRALPEHLVEKIVLDVGDMKVGDVLRVKDLDIAKNEAVDVITDPEAQVVIVTAVKAAASSEEETEAEAE